jgi:hypothetical protein
MHSWLLLSPAFMTGEAAGDIGNTVGDRVQPA